MKEAIEGLPAWAKIITTVGVPSTIALYLVFKLTAGVASAEQVAFVSLKIDAHASATERLLETQVRLSRVICRNVAKTEAAQLECDR